MCIVVPATVLYWLINILTHLSNPNHICVSWGLLLYTPHQTLIHIHLFAGAWLMHALLIYTLLSWLAGLLILHISHPKLCLC